MVWLEDMMCTMAELCSCHWLVSHEVLWDGDWCVGRLSGSALRVNKGKGRRRGEGRKQEWAEGGVEWWCSLNAVLKLERTFRDVPSWDKRTRLLSSLFIGPSCLGRGHCLVWGSWGSPVGADSWEQLGALPVAKGEIPLFLKRVWVAHCSVCPLQHFSPFLLC